MQQGDDMDYKYSLSLLRKINNLRYKGVLLPNMFFYKGYNMWHFFQQRIFEDIKIFSATKGFEKKAKRYFPTIVKDFCVNLFLIGISSASFLLLVFRRERVLVFSIDRVNSKYKGDFRIEPLYEHLVRNRIPFIEIFHTILGRNVFINFIKRKRSSFYLEALDALCSFFIIMRLIKRADSAWVDDIDFSNFTLEEGEFVKNVVKRYIYQTDISAFKIKILTHLLSIIKIKALFTIDDARYYHEIILACKLNAIKTYAFQHGHFTKYHVGWLKDPSFIGGVLAPDLLVVWSSYWKDELARLHSVFPKHQIIIGGTRRMFMKAKSTSINRKRQDITVLIPYETSCPKTEVSAYITKMLACPEVRVIFKLRPDMPKEQQLSEYNINEGFHSNFSVVTDAVHAMPNVDIVAGVYSTFLYDALAYTKRILILKTISDYGEGLTLNKLADQLSIQDDVCKKLIEIKNIPQSVIKTRRETLYGKEEKYLSDTLSLITRGLSLV